MRCTEYLAKLKTHTTYCFFLSRWLSLTNKPALHNTTNVFCFLITRSNVSYSLDLPRIWSADASFGSFLPSLHLAADSSAHCCSVPAFTPLHNWSDGSLLQFHTITYCNCTHLQNWSNYPPNTRIDDYQWMLVQLLLYLISFLYLILTSVHQ